MSRRFAGCPGHCSGCGRVLEDTPFRCCLKCREKSRKFFRDRRTLPKLARITDPWPKHLAYEVNALPSRI